MAGRRTLLQAGAAAGFAPWAAVHAAARPGTLRFATESPETTLDPANVTDAVTNNILYHLFDAPLRFNALARGAVLEPNTLARLPEVSADYRTWTLRVRPGITFEPDAVFQGRPRELVAADIAYTLRRAFDPAMLGNRHAAFGDSPPLGLMALRKRATDQRTPFDYDAPVEGLQVLDRYTLRIRLERPNPRLDIVLSGPSGFTVAREVIEHYGARSGDHPVGTGPYRLVHWTRSARLLLERRPGYREDRIALPAEPLDPDVATRLAGRQLPLAERVEIVYIQEDQTRWLSFQRGDIDVLNVPPGFAIHAAPGGRLAPFLARRGVTLTRTPTPVLFYLSFNMEDPLVGGMTAEKTALRRAIGLAFDATAYIAEVLQGDALVAHAPMTPVSFGYDASLVTEMGQYDPNRARALLDVYGYVDRDGDGWRERPDGAPLLLEYLSTPGQRSRAINEQWRRYLRAVGLRIEFRTMQFPELLKNARAGRFMLVGGGYGAGGPDPTTLINLAYSGSIGGFNRSRFRLAAYDRLYEQQATLPDGPERAAALREAARLLAAHMPLKCMYHQVQSRLLQPWVIGAPIRPFSHANLAYLSFDDAPNAVARS